MLWGPCGPRYFKHRVRLFSLVPHVWESNPKLQGGWCKTSRFGFDSQTPGWLVQDRTTSPSGN
jgi:hypothetical protein